MGRRSQKSLIRRQQTRDARRVAVALQAEDSELLLAAKINAIVGAKQRRLAQQQRRREKLVRAALERSRELDAIHSQIDRLLTRAENRKRESRELRAVGLPLHSSQLQRNGTQLNNATIRSWLNDSSPICTEFELAMANTRVAMRLHVSKGDWASWFFFFKKKYLF